MFFITFFTLFSSHLCVGASDKEKQNEENDFTILYYKAVDVENHNNFRVQFRKK